MYKMVKLSEIICNELIKEFDKSVIYFTIDKIILEEGNDFKIGDDVISLSNDVEVDKINIFTNGRNSKYNGYCIPLYNKGIEINNPNRLARL